MRTRQIRRNMTRDLEGYTILELTVSMTLFVVVLASSLALIERDSQLSRSTLGIGTVETLAQEMLFGIERELSSAQGADPTAILTEQVTSGEGGEIHVDSTLGFPDSGWLLLDRGKATEEWIGYDGLSNDQLRFTGLTRAQNCTESSNHFAGGELLWRGLAEPILLQSNPPASTWDGRSNELAGPTFFRGTGTGFSFRVPVDPDQGAGELPNYLDGDELMWGATVGGDQIEDGWICIDYVPVYTYTEADTRDDINNDGDFDDVFDIGQLRRRAWDATDSTVAASDLGLGPSSVLQEQCNYGGDMDNDGFDDPLFLWDKETRQLHVRLFVIGISLDDIPVVRKVESVMFLRNEQEF